MKALSILTLLVIVFLACFIIGYSLVVYSKSNEWVFSLGVFFLSILAGAVLASVTSVWKIYKREKAWRDLRSKLWRSGRGRD